MLVKCLQCYKLFNKWPGDCLRSPQHFCSNSCAATFNNVKFHKRKKLMHPCATCSTEVWRKRKYCKKECDPQFVDWSKVTIGTIRKRSTMNKHVAIRCHANRIYKLAKKPDYCAICAYSKCYQVCHIKAVKNFSNSTVMTVVNSLNNLIALCPNHHWELDHNLLSAKDLKKFKSRR